MNNISTYIAYSAGTLFVILGLTIIFTNITPQYLPMQFKIMMGIVLIMYGLFRFIYAKYRKKDD